MMRLPDKGGGEQATASILSYAFTALFKNE